jgi:hypothetical protein
MTNEPEEDPTQLVPLAAGATVAIVPLESGFQMELWYGESEATVRIALTEAEAQRLADRLQDAIREADARRS